MKDVDYKEILKILMDVCEKENCVVAGEVLRGVAIRARGDIRAALNDLEILARMDAASLMREVGDRDREQSIFMALQKVFGEAKIKQLCKHPTRHV